MILVEGEVAGVACNGSGQAVIMLSSDNEGSIALHPICLTSESNVVHINQDVASSSAKRKRTSVTSEMCSRYDMNRQF